MIYRIGGMKRVLAAAMLAAVLLGGCGSTDSPASSVPFVEDETPQESEAQHLEKQLIALLNLGSGEDSQIASDTSLGQAADFCLAYVLQDPQSYVETKQPVDLDGMLEQKDTFAFVYDGGLPAIQAGTAFLTDLANVDLGMGSGMEFHHLKSISVAYGEGEKGPVWLILALYGMEEDDYQEETPAEEDPSQDDDQEAEETGETGETGQKQENPSEPDTTP